MTLSYSLFGDPNSFEFPFYLRGIWMNLRMNRILYSGFNSIVHIENEYFLRNGQMFIEVGEIFPEVTFMPVPESPRCEAMLNRMRPLFGGYDVICRDADSVSTYREACCVYSWMNQGHPFHAINDNDAHGGLMGGLVAFKSREFIIATNYKSFKDMVNGLDLKNHGSDQNFMNKSILPLIKNNLLVHKDKGSGCPGARHTMIPSSHQMVNQKYWVTDLISRYIGSAGVIDFELLRFLKSAQKDPAYDRFEKKYNKIFYWA